MAGEDVAIVPPTTASNQAITLNHSYTKIGFTDMGNNIDGKVLDPETARIFKKAVERAKEALSHQNYPSTAAIHGILTEAGMDTEAHDLLIKVSTCIRDYLDKMSGKIQKKLPGGGS